MIVKFDPIFDRNKRNVHTLTHSAAAEKQNYQQISPLESKQYDSGQQTDWNYSFSSDLLTAMIFITRHLYWHDESAVIKTWRHSCSHDYNKFSFQISKQNPENSFSDCRPNSQLPHGLRSRGRPKTSLISFQLLELGRQSFVLQSTFEPFDLHVPHSAIFNSSASASYRGNRWMY